MSESLVSPHSCQLRPGEGGGAARRERHRLLRVQRPRPQRQRGRVEAQHRADDPPQPVPGRQPAGEAPTAAASVIRSVSKPVVLSFRFGKCMYGTGEPDHGASLRDPAGRHAAVHAGLAPPLQPHLCGR